MSYLTTPDLPEFKKAVISFWFKVSQEVLDAVQQEEDEWHDAHRGDDAEPPPFLGLVPLIVFGKEGKGNSKVEAHNSPTPHTETHTLHSCATVDVTYSGAYPAPHCASWGEDCSDSSWETTWSEVTVSYSAEPGKDTHPSFVAIRGGGEVGEPGRIQINFESTKMAEVSGFCGVVSGSSDHVTSSSGDLCCHYPAAGGCGSGEFCGPSGFPLGNIWGLMIWVFGVIAVRLLTAVADVCEGSGSGGEFVEGTVEYGPIPADFGTGAVGWSGGSLAGDAWHHVLISIDLSEGAAASGDGGITASCTMYVALDDEDHKTGVHPLEGTNKVVPGGAAAVTGMPGGENCGPGTYSLTDMSVPSAPVGIPCVEKYVDKIRKVQMAELLFFTDLTLDTSKEENRRHFITRPDKNGFKRPTNAPLLYVPLRKFAIGDPAKWEPGADNPAWAPPLFDPSLIPTGIKFDGEGETADIDFTKCQFNWQMGLNLGTLDGEVEKVGKIRAVVPPDEEQPRIAAG